ncbi:MAG TPA: hypothetical protein VM324_13500 [Egibacteraceae bacterium]|nr:hypothetical protein [Egibacteraceae bacterium]
MTASGNTPPPGEPPRLPPPPGDPGQPAARGARPVPIRPLNLGDVLDGAFRLFAANWRTIVLLTGVFVVPFQLLSAYLQRDLPGLLDLFDLMTDPAAAQRFAEAGGGGGNLATLLAIAQGLLVSPLVTGVIAAVVASSYLGGEAGAGEAFSAGMSRWWALVVSWVVLIVAAVAPPVVAAAVVAGASAGGVPLPVVAVLAIVLVLAGVCASLAIGSMFSAAAPAIVVEHLGPFQGLARSARLLRPRIFAVVGTVVVAILLVLVLSLALGGIPQLVGMLIGDRFGWLFIAVGGILASLVSTPLFAIVVTLLYFDGRVRREALDLRLAADGLAARTGDPGATGGHAGR